MTDFSALSLCDLLSPYAARDMLSRASLKAAAIGIHDNDHMLGAMVRHVAAPLYVCVCETCSKQRAGSE